MQFAVDIQLVLRERISTRFLKEISSVNLDFNRWSQPRKRKGTSNCQSWWLAKGRVAFSEIREGHGYLESNQRRRETTVFSSWNVASVRYATREETLANSRNRVCAVCLKILTKAINSNLFEILWQIRTKMSSRPKFHSYFSWIQMGDHWNRSRYISTAFPPWQ